MNEYQPTLPSRPPLPDPEIKWLHGFQDQCTEYAKNTKRKFPHEPDDIDSNHIPTRSEHIAVTTIADDHQENYVKYKRAQYEEQQHLISMIPTISMERFYANYDEFEKQKAKLEQGCAVFNNRVCVFNQLLELREARYYKALRGDANAVAKALSDTVDIDTLEESMHQLQQQVQTIMNTVPDLLHHSSVAHQQQQQIPKEKSNNKDDTLGEYVAAFAEAWSAESACEEPEDRVWWTQWERYNRANTDTATFMKTRKGWDRYSRPRITRDHPLPGVLPKHRVLAAPPYSDVWKTCLLNEMPSHCEHIRRRKQNSISYDDQWKRMVRVDP